MKVVGPLLGLAQAIETRWPPRSGRIDEEHAVHLGQEAHEVVEGGILRIFPPYGRQADQVMT